MSEQDAGSQNGHSDSSNDSLNGSWVKLDESFKNGNERPFSIHNGEMENLLAEAADDKTQGTQAHRQSLLSTSTDERTPTETRPESDTSPETVVRTTDTRVPPPNNLNNEQNWIENWASRVEPHPPKKWRLTYPSQKHVEKTQKSAMVERKSDSFQVNFYIVVPTLLVTHILAFGIGFYIGRRSSTSAVAV
ncbi:BCL2/adenovirus E1B 19 kDa protein-interacting protein 3-like [Dendronephthya gigantea]|uniref:BCL2/adenovirus E1B 19 kDa protein-interacting protein 3-like n=1 Tax=Dendronephthya gigantea TaxID=151771 RepID=UPI00106B6D2F|nr:BCL2/adenovirus E1B 19 kDa protein-interacting protein 3-like [Dendronephthya gigantea]